MDPEPEVIRQQIDATRSSLADKLESLENEVKGTVQSAKETVQETIASVKGTVTETVDSVKRTLDLELQTEKRPFLMLGLAFASGVCTGWLLGGRRDPTAQGMAQAAHYPGAQTLAGPASSSATAAPPRPGFLDLLGQRLGGEWDKVKNAAVTSLAGVVGGVAEQVAPALREQVEGLLANAVHRFGQPHGNGAPREEARTSRFS